MVFGLTILGPNMDLAISVGLGIGLVLFENQRLKRKLKELESLYEYVEMKNDDYANDIEVLENENAHLKKTILEQKKKIKDAKDENEELTKLYELIEYRIDDCKNYIAVLENKNMALRIENQQ